MIQQSYESLVVRIAEAAKLSVSEVESRVNAKLVELQDLVSKAGAAHIVANELKVQMFDNTPQVIKVRDVVPGLSAVTLTGRGLALFEPRSFTSGSRQGKVLNMILGDETGSVKLVVWDERLIEELGKIKEDDILKIKNAYAKLNNGFKEVHLGNRGQVVINPENETVSAVVVGMPVSVRKKIKELVENEVVEVVATVVQVFEPRFYSACPVCNKKVLPAGSEFSCQEHGVVVAKNVPIVNAFVDDGTGNVRVVCFREHAERLLGSLEKPFAEVQREVAGKQVVLRGKLVRNSMVDRVEFIVSRVEDADPGRLIAEMES